MRAGFDQPNAHIADIDYAPARELNRELILRLASCDYLQDARNIVVMGATGTGKSYLACALGMEACKQSYTVRYTRMTELFEELILARSEGKFLKFKKDIAKVDLLIIDDWMLVKLTEEESTMLLEVIHSRHRRKSTMFCSQFAPPGWHLRIPEETIADAILDRIVYDSYEIHLKSSTESPSMRQKYAFTP
ncbi:MAG: ATP-binding protein [Clostridiales bacterium]|nr:ATP-binding protein [Clostridiales bacterium]